LWQAVPFYSEVRCRAILWIYQKFYGWIKEHDIVLNKKWIDNDLKIERRRR
jgi:hypothetical protein